MVGMLFCQFTFAANANPISIDASIFDVDSKRNIVNASDNVVVKYGDITILSQSGTYYKKDQRVVVRGKVVVKRGEMTLNCEVASASSLTDRIDVSTNVQFRYRDIKGFAKVGFFDRKLEVVQLMGRPQVWQGQDHLVGDVIRVDILKNRVTTQGGARAVFSADKFSK